MRRWEAVLGRPSAIDVRVWLRQDDVACWLEERDLAVERVARSAVGGAAHER